MAVISETKNETKRPDLLRIAMGWEPNGNTPDSSGAVVTRPGENRLGPIPLIGPEGIIYQDFRPSTNGHQNGDCSPIDGDRLG